MTSRYAAGLDAPAAPVGTPPGSVIGVGRHWSQPGGRTVHYGFVYGFGRYVITRTTVEHVESCDTEQAAYERLEALRPGGYNPYRSAS